MCMVLGVPSAHAMQGQTNMLLCLDDARVVPEWQLCRVVPDEQETCDVTDRLTARSPQTTSLSERLGADDVLTWVAHTLGHHRVWLQPLVASELPSWWIHTSEEPYRGCAYARLPHEDLEQ